MEQAVVHYVGKCILVFAANIMGSPPNLVLEV